MAKLTEAEIQEHSQKILVQFNDGWQWKDLFAIVPIAMEVVEDAVAMTGAEKQESVEAILDYVIDNTDTPWLPDDLVDPILKQAINTMIPMIVDATKGKFGVNKSVMAGAAAAAASAAADASAPAEP